MCWEAPPTENLKTANELRRAAINKPSSSKEERAIVDPKSKPAKASP